VAIQLERLVSGETFTCPNFGRDLFDAHVSLAGLKACATAVTSVALHRSLR
jgi:hypothetical protein